MSNWGPWIMRRMPRVGMYIQAECYHRSTAEPMIQEGILAGIIDGCGWFLGEAPADNSDWIVYRWRQNLPPERKRQVIRKKEDAL